MRLALIAALAVLPLAPAAAQTIFDTHAEIGVPAGKVPTKAFRPLRSDPCDAASAHRQTGKLPIAVTPARGDCRAPELAARDDLRRN